MSGVVRGKSRREEREREREGKRLADIVCASVRTRAR